MADVRESGYLSIGEVLGLLLEEFPDITISKIRFLESQGLISPERTSSGYRKFYDEDVDLLRVILTEQRQNYLPLRVIKDRLETGEIDPTGEHLRPAGDDSGPVAVGGDGTGPTTAVTPNGDVPRGPYGHGHDADATDAVERAEVPAASIAAHPAARLQHEHNGAPVRHDELAASESAEPVEPVEPVEAPDAAAPVAAEEPVADEPVEPSEPSEPAPARLLPGVLLDRAELCAMVGMTDGELAQLESFGIVTPREGGSGDLYGDDAVEIAKPACAFLRLGIDARHLRNWRTAAEREASLYEQLVAPRFRQRNPQSRAEALGQLRELDELGGALRAAMTRHAMRHHFEH